MTLIIVRSVLLFLLFSFVRITDQQSQCPIGHLSFNEQKCYFVFIGALHNYFDAEIECKMRAETVGITNNRTFLVSISNAFENNQLQSNVVLFEQLISSFSVTE